MSKNTNSPRPPITQLGLMFQIRGYAGLSLGIIYVILTEVLWQNYLSAYHNAVYLIEWLTVIANYGSSSLLLSILFRIGNLILSIFLLIALKKTVENGSYISRLLQLIYTLFLIGIIIDLFIGILSYIFRGILVQDIHGLISYVQIVDEQMIDALFTKMQSVDLIFGILFLPIDIFFIIIYHLWYRWGRNHSQTDSVSHNKSRLYLGFLIILIGNYIETLYSLYSILRMYILELPDLYLWLFSATILLGGLSRILVGYSLMHLPTKPISPQITPIESPIIATTFNENIGTSIPSDSIFCSYCGNRIPSDSVFCKRCGRKIGDLP